MYLRVIKCWLFLEQLCDRRRLNHLTNLDLYVRYFTLLRLSNFVKFKQFLYRSWQALRAPGG